MQSPLLARGQAKSDPNETNYYRYSLAQQLFQTIHITLALPPSALSLFIRNTEPSNLLSFVVATLHSSITHVLERLLEILVLLGMAHLQHVPKRRYELFFLAQLGSLALARSVAASVMMIVLVLHVHHPFLLPYRHVRTAT